MKNIIYYFSGTGNSLRAARVIAKELGGAELVSVKCSPEEHPALDADVIGFVCPAYEWNIPEPMYEFIEKLSVNKKAYIFMVSTYVFIHGKSFETVETLLNRKGAHLSYGKALRCVASQCTAYEPFPPQSIMIPHSERCAVRIGRDIAKRKKRAYPAMSPITRRQFARMMMPFMNVQSEFDRGFYTSDDCIGCELCRKLCPTDNITFENGRPVWNRKCVGCIACVAYCPKKAVQFKVPEAYVKLDNAVSRRLKLPDSRTRYHNPKITAKDLVSEGEIVK